jgi:hypothetical protein
MYSHSSRFKSKTFNKLFILVGFACLFMAISTTVSADRKPKQSYQVANIVDFHSGVVVGGAATLTRSKKSVWANIHTSGLYPNSAYSIWWVVWNDPENCFDGCGEDDLEIKGNSIFHAGGFVTGDDGTANVSVHADTGSLPQGVEELIAAAALKVPATSRFAMITRQLSSSRKFPQHELHYFIGPRQFDGAFLRTYETVVCLLEM